MGRAAQSTIVPISPAEALALWTDVRRWPSFVDGFKRAAHVDPDWPAAGARLVWESTPGGRGRVTERVRERSAERLVTEVFESALSGTQVVTFTPAGDETAVELALDYRLTGEGRLQRLTDVLFIRRAQRDSLARTLRRFAAEASEEARLE